MSGAKREQAKISDYYSSTQKMGRSGGYRQRVRQRKSGEFPNVTPLTEHHANVLDSCNTGRPTKVFIEPFHLPAKHGSSPERPQVSPASMPLPSPPFPPPSPPCPQAALASSSVALSSSSLVQPPRSFSYQAPPPSSAEGNQLSSTIEQRDSSHAEQGLGSASTNSPSLFQRLGASQWRCFLVAVLGFILGKWSTHLCSSEPKQQNCFFSWCS